MNKFKKGYIDSETGLIFHSYRNRAKGKLIWLTRKKFDKTIEREKDYFNKLWARIKQTDLEKRRLSWAERIISDPFGNLMYSVRGGARNRKIIFDISKENIKTLWEKQEGRYYYTNLPMLKERKTQSPYQMSLDRIDSSIGYVPGNIVLCCQSINFAKSDFSKEIFVQFLKDITNQFKTNK